MKNENNLLKAFFTSDTRIELLAYVFAHPGESFYHRQLQKIFGKQSSQLHRELIGLEEAGFLVSYKEGHQKWYKSNPEFPFLMNSKVFL